MVLATLVAIVVSFAAVGAASLTPASAATPARAATSTRAAALRAAIAHQLDTVSTRTTSSTTHKGTTPQVTTRKTTVRHTTAPTTTPTPKVTTPTVTRAATTAIAVSTPTPVKSGSATQASVTNQQETHPSTLTVPTTPAPTAAEHQSSRTDTADDTTPSDSYTLSAATQAFLAGLNINLGSGPVTGTLTGTTLTVQVGAPALPLTLPIGNDAISFDGASLTIDESTGTLTLSATATTADGASGALSVSIGHSDSTTLAGSTDSTDLSATVTLNALPVLGTTVDLTGTLAYTGGSVSASLTGKLDQDTVIAQNVLTIGADSTVTLSTTDGLSVDGTAIVGSGNAQFTVKVSGAFSDEKNWNLSVDDDTNAPSFSPVNGLTITPAFSGSVQDKDGTVSFDVSADQPLSWNPSDNMTLAVSHVEVSNEAPPTTVACPAGVKDGQLWVDVQGDLSDSAAGIDVGGEACVDPSAQTFTLTGTGTGTFGPTDLGFTLQNPKVTIDGDLKAGTVSVSATATLLVTAASGATPIDVTLSFDSDGAFTVGSTVDLSKVGLSSLGSGTGTLLVSSKEIKSFTAPTLGVTTAIDLPAGVTVLLQYTPSQTVSSAFQFLHLNAPQTFQATASLSQSGFKMTLQFAYGDGASGASLLPSNAVGAQVYLNSVSVSLNVSESGVSISIAGSAFLQLPSLYGSTPSSVELSLNGSIGETSDGATDVSVGFDLAAAYNGSWTDAFGIQNLSIGELAGKIGVEFTPEQVIPLPTLSFSVKDLTLPPDWANAIGEVGQPSISATLDLDLSQPILSFDIEPGTGQTVALEPLRIANDFAALAGTSPLPDSVVSALQVDKAQLLFAPFGGTDATNTTVTPGVTLAFDATIGGVYVHVDGDIGISPVPHLTADATADGFHIGPVQFQNTMLHIDLEANPLDPKIDFKFHGGFTDSFTGIQFTSDVDLGASINQVGASVALSIFAGQPQYIKGGAQLTGAVYVNGSGVGFSASGYAGLVAGNQSLGQVYFTYSSADGAFWYQLQQLGNQIAQAFENAYGWTASQVTTALNDLHYGGAQIASALSSVFSSESIATIISQLEQVGYPLSTAIADVQAGLNATGAQIATALNQLGENALQIAYQLQSIFGDVDTQVATALSQAGLSPDQIAGALQTVFGDTQAAVYNTLQQIGDGGQSVLDAISGFFNTGSYWIYSNPWWSVPMFVDDSGGSQAPYNPIVQWTWNGGHNQDWYVLPTDSGYAEIVNRNSGQCLSDFGGAGAQVIQYPCYGWTSQQWYLGVYPGQSLAYTGHTVTNRWSGLDLDVSGASVSAGAAIDTWYGNGGWNQWFTFEPAWG
jgi:hypothetical protein